MPLGTAGRWVLAVACVAALALFGCGKKKSGEWERYDLELHKTILSIELPAKPSKREELPGSPELYERGQRYSVEAQETQGTLYSIAAGNIFDKAMEDIETSGLEWYYDMLGGMISRRVLGKPLGNTPSTVGNGIVARELMFETDNRLRVITIRFFIDRSVLYFLEENRPRGKPQPDATARFFDSVQLN